MKPARSETAFSDASDGRESDRAPDVAAVPTLQASSREELEAEVRCLRARVAALDAELVEVQANANAAVSHWQDRAYWLDRWHLDLNALMEKPGAAELRALLRAIRALGRLFRQAKRRLGS